MRYRFGMPPMKIMLRITGAHTSVMPISGCFRMSSIGPPTMAPTTINRSIGCHRRNWLRNNPSVRMPAMSVICDG